MPVWIPQTIWQGKDCYLIGGGPSLHGFDWGLLQGKCTIGCNSAFRLGRDRCNICLFGDIEFFNRHAEDLQRFVEQDRGVVVTNIHNLYKSDLPWLLTMHRGSCGLGQGGTLAWNACTGAAAINLAVLLGAQRIYLLGYDLCYEGERSHWHDWQPEKPVKEIYARFIAGFEYLAIELAKHRPDVVVQNITTGSRLPWFPAVLPEVHFGRNCHAVEPSNTDAGKEDIPVGSGCCIGGGRGVG